MPMDANPNPLGTVHAQGVLGLNSIMVYGENLQVAVGLNHQLAIGGNYQICINPAGLIASVPGTPGCALLAPILGSGVGGNMQLTIGTSASVVFGRVFDINLGPPKIELKGGSHIEDGISYALCGVLGAAALVWVIVYAGTKSDDHRADQAIGFQVLIDAILGALMIWEMSKAQAKGELEEVRLTFFQACETGMEKALAAPTDDMAFGPTVLATAAVIGAMVAPLIAVAKEEGQ